MPSLREKPCRTFAEVSYALSCTIMEFATDVTAKKQPKFKNLGADDEPGSRWALYANRSIARLVRSITVTRLSYGTENSRALTTTSRNTDRPHPLIDG